MRNKLNWLHISDIHFSPKTEWRDSNIRSGLISYLRSEFERNDSLRPDFIFCTGDIAFGESNSTPLNDQYIQAKEFFDELLNICGQNGSPLPKGRLFMVPGNHDVNRNSINLDAQYTLTQWANESEKHSKTINQRFNDKPKEFMDTIKRLEEYSLFVREYLPHQEDEEGRHCYGKIIEIDGIIIGIAGFNSAWTCAGPEDDRTLWLAAQWQFNESKKNLAQASLCIGLIHHPIDWLNLADRNIATNRISTDFHFWLHGHSHNTWVAPNQSHITIAAGAIGAETSEEFGINLVSLDLATGKGVVRLHQHKAGGSSWTIAPIEIHAPNGCWYVELPANMIDNLVPNTSASNNMQNHIAPANNEKKKESRLKPDDFVDRYLSKRLDEALISFSSQPKIWVDPILRKTPEFLSGAKTGDKIQISNIISAPKSMVIKAPPQFGLTCLSHYLIREAWHTQDCLWLYLDFKTLKPHIESIKKAMEAELLLLGSEQQNIQCVILDSWTNHEKDSYKLLQKLCVHFKDIPIIIMHTDNATSFIGDSNRLSDEREFEVAYLWALPRTKIRKVVAGYNETRFIGDEDAVTRRVVSDLEVLNIHRTPLNCLTLLKVSEIDFDESPINRTEMIKRMLLLLFNSDDLPTYKTKPDPKDCEYVLGFFSEKMIRENNYVFSREFFLTSLNDYCKARLIDLEIQVVFDVLYKNNIIIKKGDSFCFKFLYWINYFAAQRMHQDEGFANYIFQNMRYAQYPEIIEFYTGIDRRREDALRRLITDLRNSSNQVKSKLGLPGELNPWKFAQWDPSSAMLQKMKEEISTEVLESNLPDSVKDHYADNNYDRSRPYCQEIRQILVEYSFVYMMQIMKASAKALRNSDYVEPEIRRELFQEILNCWEQATRVLVILTPLLAQEGKATFEGSLFWLMDDFGNTVEQRLEKILSAIPYNVVSWSQDDLFSPKMGPLLINQIINESNELKKHELILLLIKHKPRNWKNEVQKYISSISKNSFYLFDVYTSLQSEYQYSYATSTLLRDIEYLIKMSAAKHLYGTTSPGVKVIKKISDDVIPSRAIDEDL